MSLLSCFINSNYYPLTSPAAGANGRFWYVSSSGLVCSDGEKPEDYFLEFVEHGRVAIKGSNGKYLRGDQGGTLKGDGTAIDASSLWEYWSLSLRVFKSSGHRTRLHQFKRRGLTWQHFPAWFYTSCRVPSLFLFSNLEEVNTLGRYKYECVSLQMLNVLSVKRQCQHKTMHSVCHSKKID